MVYQKVFNERHEPITIYDPENVKLQLVIYQTAIIYDQLSIRMQNHYVAAFIGLLKRMPSAIIILKLQLVVGLVLNNFI